MFYVAKTPWWLKKLYKSCTWNITTCGKTIYLTFDDGPHPTATTFILNELKKYNAKATFFCIGKNVEDYQAVYQQVIDEGHSVGNHTFNHLNGWKTKGSLYISNIEKAATIINSNLFRPPYGRIKKSQIKLLQEINPGTKIIMWSVLSGDFDVNISPEKCLKNVVENAESGSIIVFHDSEKAFKNLVYALPAVLDYFSKRGYNFESIPNN